MKKFKLSDGSLVASKSFSSHQITEAMGKVSLDLLAVETETF
jgi:hypothetical protein